MATLAPAVTVLDLEQVWASAPGIRGWLTTVDHKTIGIRYLWTSGLFFVLGGLAALALRVQLARPDAGVLGPEAYDELFTMHGVGMLFLYALPVLSGFSNFLWPLLLGARDMAFPRLNALSYWVFLFSGLFLLSSVLIGQAPNGGWFNYVPLTGPAYDPGYHIDFYALGLLFLGVSTTAGSINFVVTLLKMRTAGMTIERLPIMVWGTLTASVANLFAIPALTAACLLLYLDRRVGTHFFDAAGGGSPMLWQNLFWMFGHPWVYIIVLPAMGLVSEIIPTCCRRPIVGYGFVAGSTVATGILGFAVWVHHMFATGMSMTTMSVFSTVSFLIAIPSAISVFAWIATIWLGRPVRTTAFLFCAGFIALFVIGGVSGVMTAAIPLDWQLTDTYFVVAHLHYVLIGINVFPVMAAVYHWFPKFSGRLMSERLGRWHFWIAFIGFNLAFFPMHIAGILGMPRRIYTYAAGTGWGDVNLIETVGAFVFAAGLLLFFVNIAVSLRRGVRAGPNPWDAPTLEWSVPSPPPAYNFLVTPTIGSRHPLWEGRLRDVPDTSELRVGPVLEDGREALRTSAVHARPEAVMRMPGDSAWPVLLALAMTALAYGLLIPMAWLALGGFVATVAAVAAWLWPQQSADPIGS